MKDEMMTKLETIYADYYDGLYSEDQLKTMLKRLYSESQIDITKWSEMLLDAQWKYATEEDYRNKREQLDLEAELEGGGIMFFCDCGGLLLVEKVEAYPERYNGNERLDYDRSCTAKCPDCNKVYEGLKYD
ncbi:hypothetical protein [Paenibacillus soyae]|uniref:Uncharacterized protein n=1 Tax=Paenibacillus soyae TaxID=2969249 RepID=A0A9X2S9T8_9BACL|nr:hypothetical protein [Paenibacillus soyae]MCR2805385.1 hypothetical protein [Paenibacillus soyae]